LSRGRLKMKLCLLRKDPNPVLRIEELKTLKKRLERVLSMLAGVVKEICSEIQLVWLVTEKLEEIGKIFMGNFLWRVMKLSNMRKTM
jgi:hypothetical protein